jgi:hypothetical protein
MSLTKTPLSMLEGKGPPNSDVRYTGSEITTRLDDAINDSGLVSGRFDDSTGTLVLTLVNGTLLKVSGFMTQSAIGTGPEGQPGIGGQDGTDGLMGTDGDQGQQGCQGPAGRAGATGPRGQQGIQGPAGDPGPEGPRGDQGLDGVVDVYIQSDEPQNVGPAALWVKP